MKRIDLTGKTIGRWKVLCPVSRSKRGELLWWCRCQCGTSANVYGSALRYGRTRSCGCLRDQQAKAKHIVHGLRYHKLYSVWQAMLRRCYNSHCKDFPNYGGRGIKVCPRWRASVKAFICNMGPRPVGMTLDRINVNGNYTPGNCQWATRLQQRRNRRDTKIAEKNK